jgi:tetratricopeptide (TPR) repeat protein
MTEHVSPADLDRLVHGTLSVHEKGRMLAHFLCRCPRCCSSLTQHAGYDDSGEVEVEEYHVVVDRVLSSASRISAARRAAADALASLLALDRMASRLSTSELARLKGLPRLQALLETSRSLRFEDPQAMLRFAKLARFTADRLRMRDFGNQPVADLRALAWVELANAYRVCNELGRSDHAMNRAVHWCRRGSKTGLLLARVADLLADLLGYQRRFPEGRELLMLTYQLHAEMGNRHRAGRVLVKQAHLTMWEGDHRKALVLIRQGFDLLDPDQDPQLIVQTLWNMVLLLAELGRFRSARRFLWQSRILFADVIESHRLRWLEAKIHAGLEDFSRAEPAFQQARAGFAENGQVYPAALVGLDLAAVWARQGRIKDVFDLAEEMIVTFRALRIGREAVAALLVLKRACQYGGQVLDLIEITTDLLRNLERQPARPRNYSGSMPTTTSPSS